jgi:hypothetical protein
MNNTFLTPGGAAFHMRGVELPTGEPYPGDGATLTGARDGRGESTGGGSDAFTGGKVPQPPPPPPSSMTTPLPGGGASSLGAMGAGPGGEVPRMVVMSQLSDAEKEKYFEFLLENNVSFGKVENDYWVANVRMVVPNSSEENEAAQQYGSAGQNSADRRAQRKRTRALAKGNSVKIYGRRASRPPQEMARVVSAIATSRSLFDYSCYPKFSSLVTLRDSLRPRRRHYAWLMKMIEEIYDDRYDHDTADLRNAERHAQLGTDSKIPEENTDRLSNIFPVFVVDFLSKRFGLRSLVDQHAWDLLYNVHALRSTHLEVELFARFLEEYYDPDDLLFFLYVRSVVQKELVVNFVNRWTSASRGRERIPKPVLLNYRECQIVARIVFGSEQDPLYVSFMGMVDRHVQGRKTKKSDTRRIEVYQFLHVALVGYHETRPAEDEEEIAAAEFVEAGAIPGGDFSAGQILVGSKDEQERLFQEAERDYEQRMSKLADAQLAADGKAGQDKDRELRVAEMENAIERAMDARRAAQRSGAFKSGDSGGSPGAPASSEAQIWASQAQGRQAQAQASEELADAHARAHMEAESQRKALELARQRSAAAQAGAPEGMTGLASAAAQAGMDTAQLDAYLDTIAKDRRAIDAMEADLRASGGDNSGATGGGAAVATSEEALAQVMSGLKDPIAETQGRYLDVLMDSCKTLPALVVSEIKTEVAGLLDAKIQGKLGELAQALSHPATAAVAAPVSVENPSHAQLVGGLAHLISLGADGNARKDASSKFALSMIKSGDVRQEIEPMVALLVTYAQARLSENS